MEYKDRVHEVLRILSGTRYALLMTHHNPDPDALASAFGMRHLLSHTIGIRSTVAYSGLIGRAENRGMMRLLRLKPTLLSRIKSKRYKRIVLCDHQPDIKDGRVFMGRTADVVLDHHPQRRKKCLAGFADIRTDYGSTSTIVTEYIRQTETPLNARIATALYYGIKTDISDLARKKSDADLEAMKYLFPHISVRWLYKIENPRLPIDYFQVFASALRRAKVYKDAVVSDIGEVDKVDYVAELADYLLKLEGMRWSFCIGCTKGEIVFSIRTMRRNRDVGRIAKNLTARRGGSGGGHEMSAAGRISVAGMPNDKKTQVCKSVTKRFLTMIGNDPEHCTPLAGVDIGDCVEGD